MRDANPLTRISNADYRHAESAVQPALFLKDLLQRFTGIMNVLAHQFAGSRRVALTAEIQDLVMFLIGAFHAVSQVQLKARISFTTVVDVADNSHETRLIGARIEDRVKLPVKAPPRGEVILPLKFTYILEQYRPG